MVLRARRRRKDRPAAGHDHLLGPYWMERQRDPDSPGFSTGSVPETNTTARNWTVVGNLAARARGVVDERGLLGIPASDWSLDWWVGGDDRWYFPSRETAVRQRLVDDNPVVETAMHVPGGDIVHRCYGARTSGADRLVVEIENQATVPVGVGLALRPFSLTTVGRIGRVELDGSTIAVDSKPAVTLPRVPGAVVASDAFSGDLADRLTEVEAGGAELAATCEHGLAQLLVVFPLVHSASLRVLVHPEGEGGRAPGRGEPDSVADSATVARGWVAQTDREARVNLPDGDLGALVERNRRFLLLAHEGDLLAPDPHAGGGAEGAEVLVLCSALTRWGFGAEAGETLAGFGERQSGDGGYPGTGSSADTATTAAVLAALHTHWDLVHDPALAEAMTDSVGDAARWLAGQAPPSRRPVGEKRQEERPHRVLDELWSVIGLRAATASLMASRQQELAGDASAAASGREEAAVASLTKLLESGRDDTDLRDDVVYLLAAALSTWRKSPHDPLRAVVLSVLGGRGEGSPGLFESRPPRGLNTRLTATIATVEAAMGEARALDRLAWLASVASSTGTWPTLVHPRLGSGSGGAGHDLVTAAAFLLLIGELLVSEGQGPGGPELVLGGHLVPEPWRGRNRDLHNWPTAFGRLSYGIRWHHERPALLWELRPHPGLGEVRLIAPTLDPEFESTSLSGEILLGPRPTAS